MIKVEYDGAMGKLGLSLLMVIALAVSGVASAVSAADCPMASAQVSSAQMGASALDGQHNCCPDRAPATPGDEAPAKMTGCFVGQACRTATALAPDAGPLPAIAPGLGAKLVLELDPVFGSRSPDAFWRPPRTV